MESAARKFAEEASKPLRKPTKAQLERWARYRALGLDAFVGITEKDRERAWKKGLII